MLMSLRYERTDGFVYRQVAGEHLLVALKRDRTAPMFMLTPTAGVLWNALASSTSLDALVARVVEEFDVDPEVATRDVEEFLGQLRELGAVTVREDDA